MEFLTHIEGYPNFIDNGWYTEEEENTWYEERNVFDTDYEDELDGDGLYNSKKITYNPTLADIKHPQLLKGQDKYNRPIKNAIYTAIYFQRDNMRFVFDLLGPVHRIIFGDKQTTTTRIMTEEEFEAIKQQMLESLFDAPNKDELLEEIAKLSYDSSIDYERYIPALIEDIEDQEIERRKRHQDIMLDDYVSASEITQYNFQSPALLDAGKRSYPLEPEGPTLLTNCITDEPQGIYYDKNNKRYFFDLENGTLKVHLYSGYYTREMTQQDFAEIVPEMLQRNREYKNNAEPEKRQIINDKLEEFKQLQAEGQLALADRTYLKIKN